MQDLSHYQGIAQFGPAYRFMFENDAHAPGSVDRVLAERMIRLCAETAGCLYEEYTPTKVEYAPGSRPELEELLAEVLAGCGDEERVAAIARFCAALGENADDDLNTMRLGGTEEEIIRRGSDWCTDVARVGCILCQLVGIPSRLVMLADTAQAYSGHVIIEGYRDGVWGAVDVTTNVLYLHPDGSPATTWELTNDPALVTSHRRARETPYTTPGQFRAAAIAHYFVEDARKYDYTVTSPNDYYRSILKESRRGWPEGLHWLHGEDEV